MPQAVCVLFCVTKMWRVIEKKMLPIRDGWIVCDNNLLACSKKHIERCVRYAPDRQSEDRLL